MNRGIFVLPQTNGAGGIPTRTLRRRGVGRALLPPFWWVVLNGPVAFEGCYLARRHPPFVGSRQMRRGNPKPTRTGLRAPAGSASDRLAFDPTPTSARTMSNAFLHINRRN